MSNEEHAMVEMAVQWAPYGGPRDEDVLVTFGTSLPEFDRRIGAMVKADSSVRAAFRQGPAVRM